jgi:hypothetical protein
MSQNAVVSCNCRLLTPAVAQTRLNIHLRSEDFVRIVLRGDLEPVQDYPDDKKPDNTYGKDSCWIVTLRPGLCGLSFHRELAF